MEHKSYEEWLRDVELFSLEGRRVRGDRITLNDHLKGCYSAVGVSPYSHVTSDWMREIGFKLCLGRFRRYIRGKKIFIERVIKKGLLEVVESPFLKVFQKSRVLEWPSGEDNHAELTAGLNDIEDPFQPTQFYDSMKSPKILTVVV